MHKNSIFLFDFFENRTENTTALVHAFHLMMLVSKKQTFRRKNSKNWSNESVSFEPYTADNNALISTLRFPTST